MIRILHVVHGMDCGGAENMIMNLYRHFDRSRFKFDFLVHTEKKCFFDDEIISLGGRIFHVPYYHVTNQIAYQNALRTLFKKHSEIGIVHGHLGSCAHIYLKIAKEFGCFTIAHSHNTAPTDKNLKNLLYAMFAAQTCKTADFFMACGKQAGIDRYGLKIVGSKRFKVLNNAIDTQKYVFSIDSRKQLRDELQLKDAFVIGHIGRFNYQKNHDFLIDVFKAVSKKCPEARLLLIGDGDLRQEIEQKIAALGLKDKVILTGVRKDVPQLLHAMDCFVFPSHYEGLGIVAVEAQAAGLHTICADVLPPEAKVTGLFETLSLAAGADRWAKTILKYREPYVHEDTSREIRAHGYDISQTAKRLESFYAQVIKHD